MSVLKNSSVKAGPFTFRFNPADALSCNIFEFCQRDLGIQMRINNTHDQDIHIRETCRIHVIYLCTAVRWLYYDSALFAVIFRLKRIL